MGVVHPGAELSPSKSELLINWLPSQTWWPADAEVLAPAARFRFDDPAGQVGIETFIVPVGEAFIQVPMTYRSEPLEGAILIGEAEHSALGHRWVYDATSDPVYAAELMAVMIEGRGEVGIVDPDGVELPRADDIATVLGSGGSGTELHIARTVPMLLPAIATARLTATWAGQDSPVVLAWLE